MIDVGQFWCLDNTSNQNLQHHHRNNCVIDLKYDNSFVIDLKYENYFVIDLKYDNYFVIDLKYDDSFVIDLKYDDDIKYGNKKTLGSQISNISCKEHKQSMKANKDWDETIIIIFVIITITITTITSGNLPPSSSSSSFEDMYFTKHVLSMDTNKA